MFMDEIFINMITDHIDDLRSGALPKGKFIGKYMDALKQRDKENAFRYKRPQVIGDKGDDNNWLDYILNMDDEEYKYFRETLNS